MPSDPDLCDVRGCEEPRGHSSASHCRYLGSFATFDPQQGPVTLAVMETWLSRNDKHIEISVAGRDVSVALTLTDQTRKRLSKLLSGEVKK